MHLTGTRRNFRFNARTFDANRNFRSMETTIWALNFHSVVFTSWADRMCWALFRGVSVKISCETTLWLSFRSQGSQMIAHFSRVETAPSQFYTHAKQTVHKQNVTRIQTRSYHAISSIICLVRRVLLILT